MYIDSIIHTLNLFPPSIFGFQMFIISSGSQQMVLVKHRGCSKDGGIVLCDIDVLQQWRTQEFFSGGVFKKFS